MKPTSGTGRESKMCVMCSQQIPLNDGSFTGKTACYKGARRFRVWRRWLLCAQGRTFFPCVASCTAGKPFFTFCCGQCAWLPSIHLLFFGSNLSIFPSEPTRPTATQLDHYFLSGGPEFLGEWCKNGEQLEIFQCEEGVLSASCLSLIVGPSHPAFPSNFQATPYLPTDSVSSSVKLARICFCYSQPNANGYILWRTCWLWAGSWLAGGEQIEREKGKN